MGTTTSIEGRTLSGYSTYQRRPRVLAEWLRRSREAWKQKYMEVKRKIKAFQNRANDLQKSRDHWRREAKAGQQQVEALEAEVERLKAPLAEAEREAPGEKKGALSSSPPQI